MEGKFEYAQKPDEKIEQWKQVPVILASSSPYRKKELENYGFEHVTTQEVPDEEEKRVLAEIVAEGRKGTFFDPYKTEVPQRIAQAKVEYLLAHTSIPDDVLVTALDTMPMIFDYNEGKPEETPNTMWTAQQLVKPKDIDDARKMIKQNFEKILLGRKRFEEMHKGLIETSAEVLPFIEMGNLPMLVRVNTGIAIRFPKETQIDTWSSYINLKLNAVYETEGNTESLDALVDAVISTMEQSGSVTKIAGGIDYSNQEIRDLLKIEELSIDPRPVDPGIYKGFSARAYDELLHIKASGGMK